MRRVFKRYGLWLAYAVFLIVAATNGGREGFFSNEGDHAAGKYVLLAAYLGFLAFSVYATGRENFFRSVGAITRLLWGRQVGVDLYISVFLSLALIWLIEGSFAIMLLWAAPVLFFANLAILPYILLNYAEIVGRLIA